MNRRRVRFTTTAVEHIERARAWWLANRDHRDVFATELEYAVELLALLPGVGTAYERAGVDGLRRIYLEKLSYHVYYTFDDTDVIVRAFWGARREHGPTFPS